MMTPIPSFPPDAAKSLLGVFFDIDDTFTTHGRIHAEPFQALWSLRDAGLRVVPITGRPAGWCDHIARMWPVHGIVGENGALYFWYDELEKKVRRRFIDPDPVRQENRRRLAAVRDEILLAVPGAAVAGDQPYREADLAIDFCEDVPRLAWEDVGRICDIFRSHGATYKVIVDPCQRLVRRLRQAGHDQALRPGTMGASSWMTAESSSSSAETPPTTNLCSRTSRMPLGSGICSTSQVKSSISPPTSPVTKAARDSQRLLGRSCVVELNHNAVAPESEWLPL